MYIKLQYPPKNTLKINTNKYFSKINMQIGNIHTYIHIYVHI